MLPFEGGSSNSTSTSTRAKLKSTTSNPIPSKSSCTFSFDNIENLPANTSASPINSPDIELRNPRDIRTFPLLDLSIPAGVGVNNTDAPPVLIIQSPKTPTLCRKLKAVSLDSDPQPNQSGQTLELSRRDVFSMPNTPKKQLKSRSTVPSFDDTGQKMTGAYNLSTPPTSSNLKHFSSNSSIFGSQTLKTLPEIMMLQDFNDAQRIEPIKIKAKGLLERRGSNASLTIDLGFGESTPTTKAPPNTAFTQQFHRLNAAKSVSNLNLSQYEMSSKCTCYAKTSIATSNATSSRSNLSNIKESDKRKSQTHLETCGNCTIYESVASKSSGCQIKTSKRCGCICNYKCRRKSLSNENLYVPPCSMCQIVSSPISGTLTFQRSCQSGQGGAVHQCKGHRMACYPRQPDLDANQILSEEFKLHLQNLQYLQTAGSILTIADLKSFRKSQLHQEFWEVPLNLQEKCLVSGSQTKNRYKGVIPNEHSRVHLPGLQSYIQANYIKGPDNGDLPSYIATQGPMQHTCVDFWEMVWSNKTNCIVMLTQLVEKGLTKCELYFPLGRTNKSIEKSYYTVRTTKARDKFTFEIRPNTQQSTTISTTELDEQIIEFEELDRISYGPFTIRYLSREELIENCTLTHLELSRSDTPGQKRQIAHFWYSNWQDHKMANAEQVLNIAVNVLNLLDRTKSNSNNPGSVFYRSKRRCIPPPNTPITPNQTTQQQATYAAGNSTTISVRCSSIEPLPVVHCSAGIGRTGCFLAILNGMQQLRSNHNVDVLATLCSLRYDRGGMVQTAEQYELVHKVLSLYADTVTVGMSTV